MANGLFGGGNGSRGNPYLIEDGYDFNAMRHHFIGYGTGNVQGACFRQVKNISLSMYSNWEPFDPFNGTYDGRSHTITGLNCLRKSRASLFGTVSYDGYNDFENFITTIKNVELLNAAVTGSYASLFAGDVSYATIQDCSVSGTITGPEYLSGFCGSISNGIIERCSVDNTTINDNGYGAVGFIEYVNGGGKVKDCYTTATFRTTKSPRSGVRPFGAKIYADSPESAENCYAAVTLIGYDGADESCYIFSERSNDRIINSYSDVGRGFFDSYWSVDVYFYYGNDNTYARGKDGKLYWCYAPGGQYGEIWDGSNYVPNYAAEPGVGSNWRDFWVVVDGTSHPVGRTPGEMQRQSNYIGWDFEEIWDILEGESYPFLRPPKTVSQTQCQRMPMGGFLRI